MAYILGIHSGHTATAALMHSGKILACVSEERLNREKEWGGFPAESIKEVIDIAGISSSEISEVAVASLMRSREGGKHHKENFYRKIYSRIGTYFPNSVLKSKTWINTAVHLMKQDTNIIKEKLSKLGINAKIKHFDHHDCHAATAYYLNWNSNEETLIMTCDGSGDGISSTVQIGKNNSMERIASSSQYNSLGWLYTSTTEMLGMKPLSHEYKVMGLAAYSKDEHIRSSYQKLSKYIKISSKNPLEFENISGVVPPAFKKKLSKDLVFERFDNVSGALQKVTEELLVGWIRNAIKQTGINNVALAGGTFMNVKANQRILEMDEVKKFFVMPSCGDESICLGSAILRSIELGDKISSLGPIYFGREYSSEDYSNSLQKIDKNKFTIEKREDINEFVGEKLATGKIIARHNGRMEFGARALGNRSILTDPRNLSSVSKINEAIKNRDFWMPFTPSIINEDVRKYVNVTKNQFAPYMIETFDTTDLGKKEIVAAIHQKDHTTRPQMLKRDWNSNYYDLITSFKKDTGVSGCLNTSFNLHGFPIVNTPEDAIDVLNRSSLDALALGSYYIERKR